MLLDQFHQPFFAELAKLVFRFSDTVTVRDKDIAGLHHQPPISAHRPAEGEEASLTPIDGK